MKLDSNNKLLGGDSGSGDAEQPTTYAESRAHAREILESILADFSEPAPPRFNQTREPQAPPTRTPANSLSEGALEDIDPASDLGASIRNKCLELEEILHSLKSRLNHVVLDENIVLSPDANSLEAQLEHDMDTDCQEDLSLQEFLQLVQAQNETPCSPESTTQ